MERRKVRIRREACLGCGGCFVICPESAIDFDDKALIIKERCISCYLCLNYCPVGAVEKEE